MTTTIQSRMLNFHTEQWVKCVAQEHDNKFAQAGVEIWTANLSSLFWDDLLCATVASNYNCGKREVELRKINVLNITFY